MQNGIFVVCPSGPLAFQTGLVRVNCLDSLDRTNLTATTIAKFVLPFQLDALLSLISPPHSSSTGLSNAPRKPAMKNSLVCCWQPSHTGDPVEKSRALLDPLLNKVTLLWADSGDAISILYAGTRALKSDVTRTGKRRVKGYIQDGIASVTRYYLNHVTLLY